MPLNCVVCPTSCNLESGFTISVAAFGPHCDAVCSSAVRASEGEGPGRIATLMAV